MGSLLKAENVYVAAEKQLYQNSISKCSPEKNEIVFGKMYFFSPRIPTASLETLLYYRGVSKKTLIGERTVLAGHLESAPAVRYRVGVWYDDFKSEPAPRGAPWGSHTEVSP